MKLGCRAISLGLAVLLLAGCGNAGDQVTTEGSNGNVEAHPRPRDLKPIDFTLEGYPDSENVGILMADQRGYFADAGLRVDVLHPIDSDNVPGYLAEGGDEIGLLPQPQVVLSREEGMPLVAIGSLVPRPTMAIIWRGGSKIGRIADLKGKTIAINGLPFEESFLQAILARAGLTRDDVKVKSVSYGLVQALANGRADAILGSENVEGIELEEDGLEPIITPLQRLGVPSYEELVVVTRRDRLAGNPRWIHRFMSAVARGTAAAIEDPEAATAAIVAARRELELPAATPELAQAKVEATLPLLSRTAQMNPEGAARLAEWMREQGLTRRKLPVATLFTNRYVNSRSTPP